MDQKPDATASAGDPDTSGRTLFPSVTDTILGVHPDGYAPGHCHPCWRYCLTNIIIGFGFGYLLILVLVSVLVIAHFGFGFGFVFGYPLILVLVLVIVHFRFSFRFSFGY